MFSLSTSTSTERRRRNQAEGVSSCGRTRWRKSTEMRMFRRLLEASTRAASGQPGSILQVTPTPLLPHNPAAILTGPAVASSSSSPGLAAVAAGGGPSAASHDSTQPPQQRHINSTLQFNESSDELEYSILAAFSDMETVFLACISTLLPLVVALGLAFGIRHVWRKYRERRTSTSSGLPWYRGVNSRDDTAESLRSGSGAVCSQQQQQQQQSTQILSAQNVSQPRPYS
uniref:Uncharacterized protein n=1 Tax=Trichogramma kaykai TaxID=54128 RepID=A0ABD2XCP0_9HYME